MEQVIAEYRPQLKTQTIKSYVSLIEKMKSHYPEENNDFLLDYDDVVSKLDEAIWGRNRDKYINFLTKRNMLNALIMLMNALDMDKELIKLYQGKRDGYNEKYTMNQEQGKMTEKQKPNFVPIEDIHLLIKKLNNDIKNHRVRQKETINVIEKGILTAHLLFSILVEIPRRNELASLEIITRRLYNRLTQQDKISNNYILMEKSNIELILNEYKTSKKYSEQIIPLPKNIQRLVRSYIKTMKLKTGDRLFNMTNNSMTQLLVRTSRKYIGKDISTTMIRHIYLSNKYSESKKQNTELMKEQEKDAKLMAHSVGVQQTVYVKDKDLMVQVDDEYKE